MFEHRESAYISIPHTEPSSTRPLPASQPASQSANLAHSHHDNPVPRPEQLGGLGARVIGRQPRVSERGDLGGLELRVQLDDAARRRLEELCVAAVAVDAGKGARLAVHVVAEATSAAQPARDERVQNHLVADGEVLDGGADGVDPPGVFVPDGVRELDVRLVGCWQRGRPAGVSVGARRRVSERWEELGFGG